MDCAFSPLLAPFCTQTLSPIPPLLPLDTVRSIYLLSYYIDSTFGHFTYSCSSFLHQDCYEIPLHSAQSPVIGAIYLGYHGQSGNRMVFLNTEVMTRANLVCGLFLSFSCLVFAPRHLLQSFANCYLPSTSGQCHHYECPLQALQWPFF